MRFYRILTPPLVAGGFLRWAPNCNNRGLRPLKAKAFSKQRLVILIKMITIFSYCWILVINPVIYYDKSLQDCTH
jgi:hypothetical protein